MTAHVRSAAVALVAGMMLAAGSGAAAGAPVDTRPLVPPLIPLPASVSVAQGEITLPANTSIGVMQGSDGAAAVAQHLAQLLRQATGWSIPVVQGSADETITLQLVSGIAMSPEAYQISMSPDSGIRLSSTQPVGLFRAVQTLRQLLPPWSDSPTPVPGPWTLPRVNVDDSPRFAYRGAMLDVSRHFMSVDEVKRYIDGIALYKLNHLHLHLSDDQGWRIAIDGWPDLTRIGGSLEVGGTPGGFYSQEEFRELVAYAAERFITVVPEIDTPGHTNAALASYPELNCDGVAPPLYTGTAVGFSSLCVGKQITYDFLDDVVGDIAAMAPGRYYHLGGDEAQATSDDDYVTFVDRESQMVAARGKTVMGWSEILQADPGPGSVAQFWAPRPNATIGQTARDKGATFVMSPASRAYMDMKYNPTTPLGLSWAGYIEVADAYNWDPVTFNPDVTEADVLGVEAPVWTETLTDMDDVEFMVYPRLPAIAEIGWSPERGRTYADFAARLAAHGARWMVRGTNFYPSAQVPWRVDAQGADVAVDTTAFQGGVATVAAPGASTSQLVATVHWSDGTVTPATVSGTDATPTRRNGLATVTTERTFGAAGVHRGTVIVTRGTDIVTAPVTVRVSD